MSRHRLVSSGCNLLLALSTTPIAVAELSVEQIRDRARSGSASGLADLVGKDLSDLDLSGIDFRHARL